MPLGGLGTGSFELRADGSFSDWMIENQGTALALNYDVNSKIPVKDEAFIALAVSTASGVLRTCLVVFDLC